MLHLQAQDLIFSQYFISDGHETACPNLWEVLMKIHQTANLTAGILFTLILGTLLHFCYDWSGHNPFAALFLPINESVWEHLKMLFFPALIYTLFEVFVLSKTSARFLSARTLGMVLGMFFIVSSFYTCTGITGKHSLAMDILIFILAVLAAFLLSRCLEVHCPAVCLPSWLSSAILLLIVLCFFIFTTRPPALPLFQDPAR